MKAFALLWERLDASAKTSVKIAALAEYFANAPADDAAWALSHLLGDRPRRLVSSAHLREWAAASAGIPAWLFEECYETVGDLAETISLLAPAGAAGESQPVGPATGRSLTWWIEQRLLSLGGLEPEAQRQALVETWSSLGDTERFLWNKLITGAFRVGVAKGLVLKALERVTGVRTPVLAHRLMGEWKPSAAAWADLIRGDERDAEHSRPYPFLLAHPLEGEVAELGSREEWQVEWKWDGIRAQLVRRGSSCFLWSRGEELITERFPELVEAARSLPPGTVLDGEILVQRDGEIGSFAMLQRRIGRKRVGATLLREAPVVFFAFDLLEDGGLDVRTSPLAQRRVALERILGAGDYLVVAPFVTEGGGWPAVEAARAESRQARAEGLMIKRLDAPYGVGRERGSWWKWKIDPLTLDAVLIYAQRGHGRRASLYSDYTFAVWNGDELVPIAKAYSGLTDAEITEVDRFVRRNAREKFGPVRSVTPELVFELAFEGIQLSSRHKSGLAVRFPRIVRWRRDKKAVDADRLEMVHELLARLQPT